MEIEFAKAEHRYTVDGKTFPSVSQIIAPLVDFSMVRESVLEAAREFGSHVHEACALHCRDALNWQTLDPALVPYVEGWDKFLRDTGAVILASEQPIAHPTLKYAGTPDLILAWDDFVAVPDIKATAAVPPTVGIQTAAYGRAYQATFGGKEPRRYCIHLTAKGYKSHRRTDPADWAMFQSCLNIYRFKEKNRAA